MSGQAAKNETAPLVNALTVDVEDYFHAEALAPCVKRDDWDSMPSRVVANTLRALELCARHSVRGTFFILGWVAERHPRLVREIQKAGHEIACHSYWHRLIYKLSPQEFREDTCRAKQVIEDAAGAPLQGYRAPTFSIVERSYWALEILYELGFRYDSSIFPVHHDFYGVPAYSRRPLRHPLANGSAMVEFPLSTFRLGAANFPVGGGGYLRIFPLRYTFFGVNRLHRRDGQPLILYFHPWEIDPEQPRLPLPAKSRFRHYTNLGRMEARIAALLQRYKFAPVCQLSEYQILTSGETGNADRPATPGG
jgi:polysaccharide deacetylase family protein (PEP-CTERM system associated)